MPVQSRFSPDSECIQDAQWIARNAKFKRFADVPPRAQGNLTVCFHKPGKKKCYPCTRRPFLRQEWDRFKRAPSKGEHWNLYMRGNV